MCVGEEGEKRAWDDLQMLNKSPELIEMLIFMLLLK